MKIFIDASNIIPESGGAVHLERFLINLLKKKTIVEVAASKLLIKSLNIKTTTNIKFYKNHFLDKNILFRLIWKIFIFYFYLKKNNYSIAYILNGYYFFKPKNIRIVIFIQNLLPFSESALKMSNINILIKNKILLLFHNLSIKRADLTIFPSKFFYKTIKIKPKKFRIINHGVEEVFFQKRNSFKIYNHTDLNKPFKIMYLSKYESYKNHINLVCAVNILKKKNYNISLSLIGLDKKQIKGSKLLNKINSINNRYPNLIKLTKIQKHKNLNLLFNKFDLHVYPSICESFGIIILETIASSLPIICSDFSVFKEILKKNTLYFDPLNQNDIANKILYYIKNYTLRKKNTYKLRKIAKKFNWKKSCNLTLNTLLETAKNR